MAKRKINYGSLKPYERTKKTGGHEINVSLVRIDFDAAKNVKEHFSCIDDLEDFLRHQNPGTLKGYIKKLSKYFECSDMGRALTIKIKGT